MSISSDVQPDLREYERGTANACVQPLMRHYVSRLAEHSGRAGSAASSTSCSPPVV